MKWNGSLQNFCFTNTWTRDCYVASYFFRFIDSNDIKRIISKIWRSMELINFDGTRRFLKMEPNSNEWFFFFLQIAIWLSVNNDWNLLIGVFLDQKIWISPPHLLAIRWFSVKKKKKKRINFLFFSSHKQIWFFRRTMTSTSRETQTAELIAGNVILD